MKKNVPLQLRAIRPVGVDFGHRFAGRVFCIVGVLLLLVTPPMFAGGSIKGKVFDKDTKDALPGATILVKGTSVGTAADINGNYSIPNAPTGEQTIVVSYVGYVSGEVKVNIPEGGNLQQDVGLQATAIQGKEVIVTALAQGQMQAINQQLSSNKIASIVSEARIQALPDFNAAQAVSRLPGVSVTMSSGEAQKIVIRGLAPQYNKIAVGGISLASTGSTQIGATATGTGSGDINNDRSVDLTMVTPYMIKSIQVYKTLLPDMEANALGGYVNMDLREAPSGPHGDILWQSGYTQKSNTYGNYRAIASGSNRFFDDLLGVYVLGNIEQYDRNADNMSAGYVTASSVVGASGFRPVLVNSVTLNRHIETRKRYGGNVILDYALPFGSIKSVNMFSRLNSEYTDNNTTINYQADRNNKSMGFSYRNGNGNTDLAVNSLEFKNDFGFASVDLQAANTYSRNYLPLSPFYVFQQNNVTNAFSPADSNVAPENLTRYINYGPDSLTLMTSMNLFSTDYHENDQVYKGDFKVPLTFSSLFSGYIKFGGEYRHDLHENDQSTPYIQISGGVQPGDINTIVRNYILAMYPNLRFSSSQQLEAVNFTTTDASLTSSFLGNRFGSVEWAANPSILNSIIDYIRKNSAKFYDPNQPRGGGWYDGPFQELPNDYRYVENYSAGYLMTELDFGQELVIVGGARYERVEGEYSAINMMDERNPVVQRSFPVTVRPSNQYWLPMVQAKYNPTGWMDIRYAYTQTLARPAYTQLSPHFTISSDQMNVNSGNPALRPAHSYNHDLAVTFHSNDLGLLSIGGFYKEIRDFTFSTSYRLHSADFYRQHGITGLDSVNSFSPIRPLDNANLFTYMNSRYLAYVRGLEVDFQTRFWYLPSPLDGVVFGVNYTRIASKASYPYFDQIPSGRAVIYIDSTRSERLVSQPNDILNAYLGYEYGGFSARASFVFQGNSVTNVAAYPEGDGFSKDYYRWDFSARQMLPWWKGLQVYLDVTNLNSQSNISAQKSIGGFTNEQFYGLTANLGVRYTL